MAIHPRSKAKKGNRKLATVGTVKRLIGARQEGKYKDVFSGSGGVLLATTSAAVDLMPIAQGDGVVQRDGDKIRLKSLIMRYHIRNNETITDTASVLVWSQVARVLVVQWLSDGTPTLAEILQDSAAIQNLQSPYLFNPTEKFKVLYDKRHNLVMPGSIQDANDSGIPARANGMVRVFGKRLTKTVTFDAGATTGMNKLYLFAFVNSSAGSQGSDLFYHSRILYSD